MKKIKKRLSLILVLSIILSLMPVVPAMAEGDTVEDLVIPYASLRQGYKDAEYKSSISYRDALFDAPSKTYSHDLSKLSLALAMAGFGRGKNTPQDKNLKAFLTELNFDMGSYVSYDYDENDNEDSIAHAFCIKEIPASGGGTETLLVAAIRSINYGQEGWVGDFTLGNAHETGYHEDFYKAAEGVRDDLGSYIREKGIDKNKLKVWTAGYSRSAPVAGLLSELLSSAPLNISKDNIFTYTFASANYEINDSVKSNAFHLALPNDLITSVPFRSWDFKRGGKTFFLISPKSEGKGRIFERMKENYRDIMEQAGYSGKNLLYDHFEYEQPLINWLVFSLENAITSPKQYSEGIQGTVRGAIKKDVSFGLFLGLKLLGGIDIYEVTDRLSAFKEHYEGGDEKRVREDIAYFKKNRNSAEKLFIQYKDSIIVSYFANLDSAFFDALSIVERILNGAERELDLGLIGEYAESPNLMLIDTASYVVAFGEPPYIMNKHYYEVYLAYLLSIDEKDLQDAADPVSRTLMIKGDAEVSVYDKKGTRLVTVSGGRVYSASENNMVKAAFVAGDTGVFCFPDDKDVIVRVCSEYDEGFNYVLRDNFADQSDSVTVSDCNYAPGKGNEFSVLIPAKKEQDNPVKPDEPKEPEEQEKEVPSVSKRFRYAVDKETFDTVMVKGKWDISSLFPSDALKVKHKFKTPGKKTVKVSKKGIASGKKPGNYMISLEKKGAGGYDTVSTVSIRVEAPAMTKKAEAKVGDTGLDADSFLTGTDYAPTEWLSTNKKVATVDQDGNITIHKKGKTKIVAVFGKGKLSTKKKIKTALKVK